MTFQWRHYGHDSVSNHLPHDCLLKHLFRRRSKKTSKLRVTGICGGNSPVPGEFPAQMASNAENISIWWRHHAATATSALKSITRPHELYGVHCTNYIICYQRHATHTLTCVMTFMKRANFQEILLNEKADHYYVFNFQRYFYTS